jgi:pimeloyl-ACP methyl ester carboxylesterase
MPYIDVNQKRLNYSDSHPNGPPAGGLTYLFIHGLGSSQNYYGGVIPHLTPNHRCIAIDTYGSGRSTFTGLDQSIDTIADDAVKVMDGLKVSKAVLVGHSMGGTTVLQFAAKYGDRLVAVVAIGPVHPTAGTGQVFEKRIQIVSEGMSFFPSPIVRKKTNLLAKKQMEWNQWQTQSPTQQPAQKALPYKKRSSENSFSANRPEDTSRSARSFPKQLRRIMLRSRLLC